MAKKWGCEFVKAQGRSLEYLVCGVSCGVVFVVLDNVMYFRVRYDVG